LRNGGFKRLHTLVQFCNLALQTNHLAVGLRFELAELLAELAVPHEQINHRDRREQDKNDVQHQEGHGAIL